ncbi:protein SHORT-ROOT [Dorcoceras hygrometricum]|uniref:Protein SHORT-ROOT n=1 Tax=Dorcoceras hygrometricum TaxID=472368 RepID=A0A2Z7DBE4_9LAMI|nr:protein SHORT-ROOT [Dorcoceras hygrometricum]
MDTLFRLVRLQYARSFNSSRSSSGSRSSRQNLRYQDQEEEEEEECDNIFMDDEDLSSSSSRYYDPRHHQQTSNTATPTTPTGGGEYHAYGRSTDKLSCSNSAARDLSLEFAASLSCQNGKWASDILLETAKAVADGNTGRVQQLMWMLNELSSPYGDVDQKLAFYFLQALFCRVTDSGERTYSALISASEKNCSFESTRKVVLKFQEFSPWTTFGHVFCNGAIIDAFEGESRLHIIDISNTFSTQWPTLLEAIATRAEETPHLRLTTIVARKAGVSAGAAGVQRVMKEIGSRLEKFARLMGVPFKFKVVHHVGDLSELNLEELDVRVDEVLAVNCVGKLHSVTTGGNRRDLLMSMFKMLQPRIVTVVEEEADLDVDAWVDFLRSFQESLRFFRVYFETLEESFPRTSNERLKLEQAAGSAVMDLVACQPTESVERRETAARWSHRLAGGGLRPVSFNDEILDDVRALLRRYREGWSMVPCSDSPGIFLSWKDQPVVWASAWN